MNSIILVSKDKNKQEEYLKKFVTDQNISPFDQTIIQEEGSIGIGIVRKIQETMFLKPYKSNAKMIIIQDAQNLTTEAQNALLKALEEPPPYVFLFLCTTTEEVFLPTILSRCQVITLSQEKKELTNKEAEVLLNQLDILTEGTMNDKLVLAEQIASDKENITTWFEKVILYARNQMLEQVDEQTNLALLLHALSEAYKTFETTNVSPRIILEHAFLSL